MVLKIGLTGGIASGKSVVATRLRELGAVLIDADALAREVVEPGTEGLARVAAEFGDDVLDAGGRLDRPRLGVLVFDNPERLAALNGIIHPLVRARAAAITAAAPADAVVVQDIPLLVETGQGAAFHLVVVVDAGDDVRLQRMLEHRGMGAEAARARMAAQATRGDRLAAADVVLDNSGTLQELLDQVDRLWAGRLVPFAAHLSDGTPAPRRGGPVLEPYREDWAREAQRIMSRLRHAVAGSGMPGADKITLEHVGSTSVPGLAAKDVLDLQLAVPDLGVADALDPVLAAAGFPRVAHITSDSPMPATPEPGEWAKRFHANADPGRAVNLHVRATGSAGWRYALMFRDWLRAEPDAAADYLALKRRLAAAHAGDATTGAYAEAKEDWFSGASEPLERWAGRTAWQPPSYAP